MNALEKSNELHREAERLLMEGGIDEILRAHADVLYAGSYALNLMAWPDIDIAASMFGDPFNKLAFFELGKRIGQLENIVSMKFTDWYRYPVDPLPQGLYWGIRIANTFSDVPWKIDLWSLKPSVLQEHRDFLKETLAKLTPHTRKLIIDIKLSLLTDKGRTPTLSGFHIYQAVLMHGMTKRDEIVQYLRDNGVEL